MTIRIPPLLLCPFCESLSAYGLARQGVIWKTCSACRALKTCGKTGSDRRVKSHGHLDEMLAKLIGKESL